MTIRSALGGVARQGFPWALTLALSASLSACDKNPTGPSAKEEVPRGQELPPGDPAPVESDADAPAEEEQNERPQSAVEPEVVAAAFDDSAPPEFKKSYERLAHWVKEQGGTLHAALVDLETGKWLLKAAEKEPVNPASNAKILTAAAALELLGPAYQFPTKLYGDVGSDGSCKRMVIEGGGAPDLSTADLYRLVRVALGEGLVHVDEIVVDQSRFTERFVPPAFEQQPGEWAPFRAPISALSLNENVVSLNVVPVKEGSPARVWYDPPGIVKNSGDIATAKKGAGDRVTWSLNVKDSPQRPVSQVGGSLGEGLGRRRYERRLEDPRLAGGLALAQLLREAGVKGDMKVSLGQKKKEDRIALWYSESLAELVRALGKDSNNFVAEMLFVALSSTDEVALKDEGAPWSSERGAAVVKKWLSSKKIDVAPLQIKNGSGLFDANRVSAEVLTQVLAVVEDNPRIYQDFVSHLAMGQTDGTMKKRMTGADIGARIRAKTGTLRNVDALSGYVLRPQGKSPAAFSIIVVDTKAAHGTIRSKVDEMVLSWARDL